MSDDPCTDDEETPDPADALRQPFLEWPHVYRHGKLVVFTWRSQWAALAVRPHRPGEVGELPVWEKPDSLRRLVELTIESRPVALGRLAIWAHRCTTTQRILDPQLVLGTCFDRVLIREAVRMLCDWTRTHDAQIEIGVGSGEIGTTTRVLRLGLRGGPIVWLAPLRDGTEPGSDPLELSE